LLLIGLSIAAAIIASQALISGTFSLTRQAIQLGYFPRLKVLHTNPDQRGQIYLPLAVAVGVLIIMHTWKSGRTEIQEKVYSGAINELQLAVIARSKSITRVPGSAVFMAAMPHVGLGEIPVCVPEPECPPGEGLLQGPADADHRDRFAGAALARPFRRYRAPQFSALFGRTQRPATRPGYFSGLRGRLDVVFILE